MKRSIAVCLGLLALASPAAAESPVAVVEDVKGKVTGAEFMDYVTPKAVIKIGDGGSVILSYLKSCRRETISGAGTVIVGTEESAVHLADVKAEKTNCDPNQANATTRETSGVAHCVDVRVEDAGLLVEEVVMERSDFQSSVENGGHDRIHFFFSKNKIAHHHIHSCTLCQGYPSSKSKWCWRCNSIYDDLQITSWNVDLQHTILEIALLAQG